MNIFFISFAFSPYSIISSLKRYVPSLTALRRAAKPYCVEWVTPAD